MRWLTYFILGYVALGLQSGLGPFITWHGVPPNLVLLAVLFIALNAPRDAALLGCLVLGLMQDLLTQEPLGIYSLSYGLTAMFVISTQRAVYREHPLTHFSLALIGGLINGGVLFAHDLLYPPRTSLLVYFVGAVYTGLLAVPVLWLLQRLRRLFAFESGRRRPKFQTGR